MPEPQNSIDVVDCAPQGATTPKADEHEPSNHVVLQEQTRETVFPKTTKDVSQRVTTTPEETSEEEALVHIAEVLGYEKLGSQAHLDEV